MSGDAKEARVYALIMLHAAYSSRYLLFFSFRFFLLFPDQYWQPQRQGMKSQKNPDLDLYEAVSQRRRARSQDLSAGCEVGNSGNK